MGPSQFLIQQTTSFSKRTQKRRISLGNWRKREEALKGNKSFEDVHRKLFQGYLLDCTIISMGSIKALKNMRNIKPCQRVMKINSKELFCSGLPGQLHNLPHLLHGKVLLHLNAGEPRQFPPRLDLPKRKNISLCSAQVYQLLLTFLFQFISSLSQKHQHPILLWVFLPVHFPWCCFPPLIRWHLIRSVSLPSPLKTPFLIGSNTHCPPSCQLPLYRARSSAQPQQHRRFPLAAKQAQRASSPKWKDTGERTICWISHRLSKVFKKKKKKSVNQFNTKLYIELLVTSLLFWT